MDNSLIKRQAAIDGKISIQRTNGVEMYSDEAVPVEYLKALPSAQPERKKCKWDDIGGIFRWGCPICHHAYETKYNFCPKCGSDMRGEQDD